MFITFEGMDGSGKTTALNLLKKYLESENIDFVFTREPGNLKNKETKLIRKIILNPKNHIEPMAEALLYAADRNLHIHKVILPALKDNKLILCDRYIDSSLAYQGAGRELGIDNILKLQEIATESTFPDLTIFFDLPLQTTIDRTNARRKKDRLELADDGFKQKVYNGYKELIKRFPNRFKVVDASQSKEAVFEDVKKIVLKAIGKK